MFANSLIIEQLEYNGYLRVFQMQGLPDRPLAIAFADELDQPHSCPFHFLDGHYKEVFDKGFAECKTLKLANDNFVVVDGEYRYRTFWKGIPTFPNSLSCYALLLPEFALPIQIRFCDPHSDVEYTKSVVRDNRHRRFVTYLECRSKHGSFDFVLEARFRSDENNFPSARYKDECTARSSANMRPYERLVPAESRAAVRQFLSAHHRPLQSTFAGTPSQPELIPSVTVISANRVEVFGETASQNPTQSAHEKPKAPKKLPPKRQDYSEHFDRVRLTEKQREVVSLILEHGLKVSEIASRLGLSRKTVYDHYHAAKRKLDIARTLQSSAQKRAQRPD
jgi:DNA-binding CsgD family transcriptional regulator